MAEAGNERPCLLLSAPSHTSGSSGGLEILMQEPVSCWGGLLCLLAWRHRLTPRPGIFYPTLSSRLPYSSVVKELRSYVFSERHNSNPVGLK